MQQEISFFIWIPVGICIAVEKNCCLQILLRFLAKFQPSKVYLRNLVAKQKQDTDESCANCSHWKSSGNYRVPKVPKNLYIYIYMFIDLPFQLVKWYPLIPLVLKGLHYSCLSRILRYPKKLGSKVRISWFFQTQYIPFIGRWVT